MIARAAQAAVERAIGRIEQAAGDTLPDDVIVERVDGGLRLSGPGLARRWLADADLRAFASLAGRGLL
jgi:hypothetical protein